MAVIREEKSNSKIHQLLAPSQINADKDDITALDVSGFNSALITVLVGASHTDPADDKQLLIALKHSDDNITFEDCSDNEIIGVTLGDDSGTFVQVKTKPAADTSFMVAYIGDKRYVRPIVKLIGDLGDGIFLAIGAILQDPKYMPVS